MANFGIAAGGFADAFQQGMRDNNLNQFRQQELALQQQAQQNAKDRDQFARIDKTREEMWNLISTTVGHGLDAGHDPQTIAQSVQPLMQPLKRLARSSGMEDADATYDAMLAASLTRPSPFDVGRPAARSAAPTGAAGDARGAIMPPPVGTENSMYEARPQSPGDSSPTPGARPAMDEVERLTRMMAVTDNPGLRQAFAMRLQSALDPYKTEKERASIDELKATTDYKRSLITEGLWDQGTLDFNTEQVLAGDTSPFTNVGRGTQGGKNLAALRENVARVAKERGITGDKLASVNQQFKSATAAMTAGARTAATREANLGIILETVRTAAPAALAASEKVPRGNWVPLNKLMQMGETAISDPNLKVFRQKNLQVAELWAKSMNPTGVMRVEDRNLALGILGTADGPEAYKAAIASLMDSIGLEKSAAISFMKERGLGSVLKAHPDALSESAGGGTSTSGTSGTSGAVKWKLEP